MWKSLTKCLTPTHSQAAFLIAENLTHQQLRTTFILKRKTPPLLHKKGREPKKLRSRHYVYELIKDTNTEKQPLVDVILTSFIDGVGNAGDKISVKRSFAYNNLLLPKLAVYATPENITKYVNTTEEDNKTRHSSKNALLTMGSLSRICLSIIMNKDSPWTLKPWHIKASFRKAGIVVPEEAITMPEKTISGPDLSIENKEFLITVTINNLEETKVRCKIHHWSTEPSEKLPYVPNFWEKEPEVLFAEDTKAIEGLVNAKNLIKH